MGPEGAVSAAFDDIAERFADSGSDGHGREQLWQEPLLMNDLGFLEILLAGGSDRLYPT